MKKFSCCLLSAFMLTLPLLIHAQTYEIVIKGGHLIDPKNNIDQVMDIAVANGTIAKVAADIPASSAGRVIAAHGLYVTPGFIDIHSHNYYGVEPNAAYRNSFSSLDPDGFTFRAGVTTVVDAGSSGWRNFPHFKEQVIDRSKTRVLAFLNIVGHGMAGHPWEQNVNDMDPKMTAMTAKMHKDIVGIKLAHYSGHEWVQVDRMIEAASKADVPVMVDFGSATPPLSLETLFMEKFRPGDIYTHVYGGGFNTGRQAVVDSNANLRPFILAAQKRGVIFDVGHGGSSFSYGNAIPALKQGLKPNTISTDIHRNSMNAGMKDMSNVMSKMLNLGMSLQEVIAASTWTPATVIKRTELGHLSEGAVADITIFNLRKGEFGFIEGYYQGFTGAGGGKIIGTEKIETELTIREGNVVYDLNGLFATELYQVQ